MDDFHLDMKIRFSPDESTINELNKTFDAFSEVKIFGDDEQFKQLKQQLTDFETRRASLAKAKTMLDSYRDSKGNGNDFDDSVTEELKKYIDELIGSNRALAKEFGDDSKIKAATNDFDNSTKVMVGNLKTQFLNKLSGIASSFLSSIGNLFKNAWGELNVMLQSSLLTNSNTRENAFKYGFSPAESYGFDKAKNMLGIQSDEDLIYMEDLQKQKFQEIMSKYADKYNQLYDSGFFDKYLEFQIEMEEFKLDMQMEIVEFFMQNKDTIIQFMEISMKAMEFIVAALGWLMDNFFEDSPTSDKVKAANMNDIIKGYTTNNKINNVSQTFNNNGTFNGTTDSQKQAYLDMLNAQMVEAKRGLGGMVI